MLKTLKNGDSVFKGIWGYENTVIPDIERAILAQHNINFLGLRGQAKTRIARMMVFLLDEWIPIVQGSELNDDPLRPISHYALSKLRDEGDNTAISWLNRNERYLSLIHI